MDDRERGSGTVLSISLIIAAAAVAFILATMAAGFDAKHRADSAADFGALAAAETLHDPFSTRTPCEAAARVMQEVELVRCTVQGPRVIVETSTRVSFGIMRSWELTGQAEAGPR